jgi:hypothetical protein
VFAFTPQDLWAVATDGTIVHFSAGAWSTSDSGTDTWLSGIWASGENDLWAVGSDGAILHKRR